MDRKDPAAVAGEKGPRNNWRAARAARSREKHGLVKTVAPVQEAPRRPAWMDFETPEERAAKFRGI
ncbi:MAG: hypothetical protein HY978_04885 [Candidatus Liptonbacteria bacterium]|nr:hypothetical protein [Candidatus Liptonbacteria bacterium]